MTDLERFIEAQKPVYDFALGELNDGYKKGHWMWFVFPQIAGLGRSETAQHYAISSLDEAKAYLAHPRLGRRLRECVATLLRHKDHNAYGIFGAVDAVKLRSSMTLFALADPDDSSFRQVLDQYFDGEMDPATISLV